MTQVPTDFESWWSLPAAWVEPPNHRRSGWSGMMKASLDGQVYYIKKQCNHLYRSWQHPLGQPTTSREHLNLKRIHGLGIGAPAPVFHGSRQSSDGLEGILVTRELTGYLSLDQLQSPSAPLRRELAVLAGTMIGNLHKAGLQHCCLYDKHIMVNLDSHPPHLAMIDLEKMRAPILKARGIARDLDQLKRHQKLWEDADWAALLDAHRAACA